MESKILNFKNKFIKSIFHVKGNKIFTLVFAVAGLVSLIYLSLNRRLFDLGSNAFFADIIDPIITILTFTTALLIGWYNYFQTWVNGLQKRLTVYFIFYYDDLDKFVENLKFKNQRISLEEIIRQIEFIKTLSIHPKKPYCIIICEEALLAHEGDIRNWGQQLGSQYDSQSRLSFHPFFTLGKNDSIVEKSINQKKLVTKQYSVFIFLDKIPDTIIEKKKGSLSFDNYDDKPSNENKNFEIVEIDFSNLLTYEKSQEYISKLK